MIGMNREEVKDPIDDNVERAVGVLADLLSTFQLDLEREKVEESVKNSLRNGQRVNFPEWGRISGDCSFRRFCYAPRVTRRGKLWKDSEWKLEKQSGITGTVIIGLFGMQLKQIRNCCGSIHGQ